MKIRKAKKSDLKKILILDKEANKEIKWWFPLGSSELLNKIKKGLVYISEEKMEIAGFQIGGFKEKQLLLEDIYVKKKFRNRGVAKKLIKKIIQDWGSKIKEARLNCPPRLKKFYEKFGFKPISLKMRLK